MGAPLPGGVGVGEIGPGVEVFLNRFEVGEFFAVVKGDGFDTTTAVIQFAFGQKPDLSIGNFRDKYAVVEFLDFEPGHIRELHVLPEGREHATVLELHVEAGDRIESIMDSRFRPGYYIVAASDEEELWVKRDIVRNAISIDYG